MRRKHLACPLAVAVTAVLVCGPLLFGRGFALVGDMVFVPHQPWKVQWLGADGSIPRAVPADALVSALTQAVPGDLLQKVVLVALLLLAGLGVLRLLGEVSPGPRTAAAVFYIWNPFVYERLAIGHWALLCGYAALPWVVGSAHRLRQQQRGWAGLAVGLAAAGWTSPTGGLLATLVAVLVAAPRLRAWAGGLVLGAVLNLPWLLPGALNAQGSPSDPSGVGAFAAKSDGPLGVLGSVLSFGGMWKTSVAPDLHPSWLYAGLALALAMAGLLGVLLRLRQRDPSAGWWGGLAGAALVGLVLALLPATPWGAELMRHLVKDVPGAGILRDSQKWIAPYVLLCCCGFGHLLTRLTRTHARGIGWGAALLPVLALPTLAWGLAGTLKPAPYPAEWHLVAQQMARLGAGQQRTAVLPWSAYRRFGWAGGHAVLDPAFRFFPGQVLTDQNLSLGHHRSVSGADPVSTAVARALADGDLPTVLRREGVRWVLVEKQVPGAAQVPKLGGAVLHDGRQLTLLDLGGGSGPVRSPHATAYYAVDGAVVAIFLWVVGSGATRRLRLYSRRERLPALGEGPAE